jgi:hypothetical protein
VKGRIDDGLDDKGHEDEGAVIPVDSNQEGLDDGQL